MYAPEAGHVVSAVGGGVAGDRDVLGMAEQVQSIKFTLKAPKTKPLKVSHDGLLSNFAFNFNLRRYNWALDLCVGMHTISVPGGRGLHSSSFQLNLSRL